jgi:hypothetical protein
VLVFSCDTLYSQAGINLYGGLSKATNRNTSITPEGSSHGGWHIGADARLNRGKMYFVVGLQYHKIDLLPSSDILDPIEAFPYSWTKVRVGLGYKVINFSDDIYLRGHTLASFNLVNGVTNDAGAGVFTNYNSGTAGANLGLGLDIFCFTITASYEIGFFNLGNMLDGSEMDFLTLSAGVKF